VYADADAEIWRRGEMEMEGEGMAEKDVGVVGVEDVEKVG
jgi:hypothetical protein